MRAKAIVLFLLLLLVPGMILAGTTGKIKGKVTDKESKEALVGANLTLVGTSYGAATNIEGEYLILNIPAGVYTVKATYVGYATTSITKVTVNSDFTTELNVSMTPEAVAIGQVEIIAERPLVKKDYTNTTTIKSAEEINQLPIRGVTNVVGLQASVVQNEGSNLLYVRGGRSSEVAYLIDGVPVNNPLSGNASQSFTNINQNNVEELQVQTGGFNAEYGSAMSGLINLNTKSGGTKYTVNGEFTTDAIQKAEISKRGGYGFNVFNLSVGGPIVPESDVATLYLSAERQDLKDNDPRSVAGVKPNTTTKSWNFNGKLSLRPINEMDVKLGGYLYTRKGQNWDNIRRFLDSEHHQRFDDKTMSLFARVTHNIGTNVFYTLQGSFFNENTKTGDGVWFEDLLSYGDARKNPSFQSVRNGAGNNHDRIFNTIAYPGEVIDRFTKQNSDILNFTGDVSVQAGHHLLKAGVDYRMYKVRRYTVTPMGLADSLTGAVLGWQGYRNQEVEYYGYNFDGSEYTGEDAFFATADHKEGARKPVYFAAYIQDKFEIDDLVLNLGIRMDRFDAKEMVFKDPANPFGARGTVGGGVFDANDLTASTASTTVSPRLGFSFPITDKAVFHAQYGTFLQMPALQYL
ncbi:MAG: carboxypeptidase-like regulatory domain-containing protein, partial [Ignavibacteriae bacterium]|nr:carboxypeptidase-like regulatory domain-containing protein [Ignavibacteriota bacterium]